VLVRETPQYFDCFIKKIVTMKTTKKPLNPPSLSLEEARSMTEVPNKKPKADKDVLHDGESLKMVPIEDDTVTIISVKRKGSRSKK
jgi:hypothetical protein